MVNGRNRTTLQDLAFLKDQLPAENKQVKKKPKKKQTSKWPKPGSKIPLQVLQFDDLEILDVQNQAQYRQLFDWQEILSSLLSIQTFKNRVQQVDSLIKDEQPKRERSNRKTEFEKILVRINDDHHSLSNEIHRMRIHKEILTLEDQRIRKVLTNSVHADSDIWQPLYDELNQRVRLLACEVDTKTGERKKAIVTVQYPWRVRVGGLPGFRERLLPAMHPVYGIPYVPASTIKGILRAWAVESGQDHTQIKHLLGFLEGSKAAMAAVEILDAFPEQPSLSVDVATPQWSWQGDNVSYGPSPHQMLSLENLSLNIGLTYTSYGNEADVKAVMGWLEQALRIKGLGSRVSAGYGQATQVNNTAPSPEATSCRKIYPFKFWSQGMYGATPPAPDNGYNGVMEFRTSSIRGVLRYWFRAIALGFYSSQTCKTLEQEIFGSIDPKPVAGKLQIKVCLKDEVLDGNPHYAAGDIFLESQNTHCLVLMGKVLELAVHLGGVGRGSRRPLHWNDGMRGCYWQLESPATLPCDYQQWQNLLNGSSHNSIRNLFQSLHPFGTIGTGDPGTPGQRQQDVLNQNCRIYLVEAPNLKHPQVVGSWEAEGKNSEVRGPALKLLYSNQNFKGGKPPNGKPTVGGKLGTPSYVTIQSNFPISKNPYQAVTIFGANHHDRQTFENKLARLNGAQRIR
ncbi:MAG: type III-B CRISPR module RAMP protein Cmr1 [Thainema sp.]